MGCCNEKIYRDLWGVKMRIGIITYDFYPFEGGQGRHVYEIFKRVKNNSGFGFKILVFSPCKNTLKDHIQIFPIVKKFGKNLLFSFFVNVYIKKLIKRHNLDLVHFHGGPGGVFLLKKLNIPIIYTAHHTYYQQYRLVIGQKWKWIFSKLEPIQYELADKIICVSKDTKDILVENYRINEGKISVIPNGVDTKKFHPLRNTKRIENSILFVGRLDERKGVDFLVKTIPLVKKEIPNVKLFVGGKGKLREELENFVKLHNLESNVKFLGFVPDEKLPKWYNQVKVVVIPSIFEGFGITAIEAMACGTPVIGTKVPGIVDIINDGKTGLLVPSQNSKELANAIIRVLRDEKLRQLLCENGRKEVTERFDWDRISQKFINIYKGVLK